MTKSTRILSLAISILSLSLISFNTAFCAGGLDYPVGKPDGSGFHDAQDFGTHNDDFDGYHLGEDWNGAGCSDCDLGASINSISDGVVLQSSFLRVWGNVVLIQHQNTRGNDITALYAHLKTVSVNKGEKITRGQQIGTIGKGDANRFAAHLHFEVRDNISIGVGTGYGAYKASGWVDPSAYIDSHRPIPEPVGQTITAATIPGQVTLTWDKNGSPNFDRYEVYRAETAAGTENPAARTKIFSTTDPNQTTFTDTNLNEKTYYYKIATFYKNGTVGYSAEVSVAVKRVVQKITAISKDNRNPYLYNGKLYWETNAGANRYTDPLLLYFDITTGKIEVAVLSPIPLITVFSPYANGDLVAFYGYGYLSTSGRDVYYYNFATRTTTPISFAPLPKDQIYPVVSDNGLIFWMDYQTVATTGVKIYYLDTKTSIGPQLFVDSPKSQIYPHVWGNKVVWKDNRNYVTSQDYDIYIKEIGGGAETKIISNVGDSDFDFWDKYIVWDYKGKLSLYNLETGQTKTIRNTGVGYFPKVRDGKVVYTVWDGTNYYLWVYDISAGTEKKIDFAVGFQPNPTIWQDYVAFDSCEDKTKPYLSDIYLTKL